MIPPSSVDHPTLVVESPGVAKQGQLRLGCSAILFDQTHTHLLLTRRMDNAQWCLPGGMIDPGESVQEGCEREFLEETALHVRLLRLVGVYSNPDRLTIYPDGNKAHVIVLCFEVEYISGILGLSNETTDARYFPLAEATAMPLFHGHVQHIQDSLTHNGRPFIR